MEMTDTAQQAPKRLFKSRQNRIIDGVCGGIAEYFEVDPTIVRILWVIMTLLGGSGIILYIVAMIVMPANPSPVSTAPAAGTPAPPSDKKRFFGIALILIGAFILVANFDWFTDFPLWSFSGKFVLPFFFILVGALFIYIQVNRRQAAAAPPLAGDASAAPQPAQRELHRSRVNKKLFGVCGGLAAYFSIDPTVVRILFVVMIIATRHWGLLLYIALGLILPEEKIPSTNS
jgi:phage shock protein C